MEVSHWVEVAEAETVPEEDGHIQRRTGSSWEVLASVFAPRAWKEEEAGWSCE